MDNKKDNEKVLISAIGGHDPFGKDRLEGAMLHIVRKYKPVKVYLYFTKGMVCKKDECVDEIKKIDQNIAVESHVTDIENPASFDIYQFHEEFSGLINLARNEYDSAAILLNVTSGTSQMTLALCAEVISHKEVLIPIQVDNPEFNKGENRCHEVQLLGFKKTMLIRQIKDMLIKWDYTGAYSLLNDNKDVFANKLRDLLEHAYKRSIEDKISFNKARRSFNDDTMRELYPMQANMEDDITEETQAFDRYQVLALKHDRCEITDFVLRAYSFSEFLFAKEMETRLDRLTEWEQRRHNNVRVWNRDKVERNHPGLIPLLIERFNEMHIFGKELTSLYFGLLAEFFDKEDYILLFNDSLRRLRNGATHGIAPITENDIVQKCFTTSKTILETIQKCLMRLYNVNSDNACFTIFGDINDKIEEELDRV